MNLEDAVTFSIHKARKTLDVFVYQGNIDINKKQNGLMSSKIKGIEWIFWMSQLKNPHTSFKSAISIFLGILKADMNSGNSKQK